MDFVDQWWQNYEAQCRAEAAQLRDEIAKLRRGKQKPKYEAYQRYSEEDIEKLEAEEFEEEKRKIQEEYRAKYAHTEEEKYDPSVECSVNGDVLSYFDQKCVVRQRVNGNNVDTEAKVLLQQGENEIWVDGGTDLKMSLLPRLEYSSEYQRMHSQDDKDEYEEDEYEKGNCCVSIADFKEGEFTEAGLCFIKVCYIILPNMQIFKDSSRDEVVDIILKHCETRYIPKPTLMLSYGHDIILKWVFKTPLPAQYLPVWKQLQSFLEY